MMSNVAVNNIREAGLYVQHIRDNKELYRQEYLYIYKDTALFMKPLDKIKGHMAGILKHETCGVNNARC